MKLQGKAWKFDDNINTDLIIPARYMTAYDAAELGKHCMEDADPEFSKKVRSGDIIIAGENFGCGSSREQAPQALKQAHLYAVVAKSFARIFFRNSINTALPIIESKEAASRICDRDEILVDTKAGLINNLTRKESYKIEKYPPFMQKIFASGGLIESLKKRKA